MVTNEKAINIIREQISELNTIHTPSDFEIWQSTPLDILDRIVPKNTAILDHLEDIDTSD